MDEIKRYVDALFSRYKSTPETQTLKEEIRGNLEEKYRDLLAEGWTGEAALNQAKQSITRIDGLIEGNFLVYTNRFRCELIQWILIYLLGAWILALPLLVFRMGGLVNLLLFLGAALAGIVYLVFLKTCHTEWDKKEYLNILHCNETRKFIWALWGIFILVMLICNTALIFGSNIWFGRPVTIDGPYQFAAVLARYLTPVYSIVIPVIFQKIPSLAVRYEVEEDEIQE